MTRTEAFEESQNTGVKIIHESFEEGDYIYCNTEENIWYDNEGDETLPQQFTGEFFENGWELYGAP